MKGLRYHRFRERDSRIHLLAVDLSQHQVRPVMAAPAFPFQGRQPALDAIAQGALACVAGGYNIVISSGLGVVDEPQHALVLDSEIWTTGGPGGGQGFLIGDGFAFTQKNLIEIHLWLPDHSVVEVEHVNRGHDGSIVAFTSRGGLNEIPGTRVVYSSDGRHTSPIRGKSYVSLTGATAGDRRAMVVTKVSEHPIRVWPNTTVLESAAPLGLKAGDEVTWVQHLGMAGVHTIVSGVPELLHDGENIVNPDDLDPHAPEGPDNWWVRPNPRTALGSSADGKTAYLCTVQGRIPTSEGLRLKEFGHILQERGVANAVNMDGGGSAFMWMKDGGPDHGGTLLAPGCYNTEKTMVAGRPAHFSFSVF